jgi:hypothetical protein
VQMLFLHPEALHRRRMGGVDSGKWISPCGRPARSGGLPPERLHRGRLTVRDIVLRRLEDPRGRECYVSVRSNPPQPERYFFTGYVQGKMHESEISTLPPSLDSRDVWSDLALWLETFPGPEEETLAVLVDGDCEEEIHYCLRYRGYRRVLDTRWPRSIGVSPIFRAIAHRRPRALAALVRWDADLRVTADYNGHVLDSVGLALSLVGSDRASLLTVSTLVWHKDLRPEEVGEFAVKLGRLIDPLFPVESELREALAAVDQVMNKRGIQGPHTRSI